MSSASNRSATGDANGDLKPNNPLQSSFEEGGSVDTDEQLLVWWTETGVQGYGVAFRAFRRG